MHRLIVQHVSGVTPHRFTVQRLLDGKATAPAEVPSPHGYPIEDRPESDLTAELRWYLEDFLQYPFHPSTERAGHVLSGLKAWGQEAFTALFGGAKAGRWLAGALDGGPDRVSVDIVSDDPAVLGWPWEALDDPERGPLAQLAQVGRRLNGVVDPPSLPRNLPRDRVNVLLVTARPYSQDVAYRSVSGPLVETVGRERALASVHLLRPPTLGRLREHLAERPDHYHIVHFDGHGAYGAAAGNRGGYAFRGGPQGCLVFETKRGEPHTVPADTLAMLLREHRVPAVVLNACQSGMIDAHAEDAFASVASAMLKAGVRSVVAMAYSLYVSGAHEFLPAFYRRLFETASPAASVRAGRQQMLAQKDRVCARGRYPLEDWIVPVLYEQDRLVFDFSAAAPDGEDRSALPPEAEDGQNPYGFIGRDGPILEIERAMRRKPAGVLIQGLGGVGKTTLARGFVQWLRDTDGLGRGCFWFGFDDVHGTDYVLNRMGEALTGAQFATFSKERKVDILTQVFRENPFVIVWDNFESARGVEGTEQRGLLSDEDQATLKAFLEKLRGGRTTVLITSRSLEDWLGQTNCYVLPIGGLRGEERWRFCEVVLDDLGLTVDRADPDLAALMDRLGGHPLLMRVVLSRLSGQTAAALLRALEENLEALGLDDSDEAAKVVATLRFVETGLPADLRPLLAPLALFEQFVHATDLAAVAGHVDGAAGRSAAGRLLSALATAGLIQEVRGLRSQGESMYQMHPVMTTYLRSRPSAAEVRQESWARAFVPLMARFAHSLVRRQPHVQRRALLLYKPNLLSALEKAIALDLADERCLITELLAADAFHMRNYEEADGHYRAMASLGGHERKAVAYHQLGRIARKCRGLEEAERWYNESLDIEEKVGNEHGAAVSRLELGIVSHQRGDYDRAKELYSEALAVFKSSGDSENEASTYHELGVTARELGDYGEAERWYGLALGIYRRHQDLLSAALTCFELGNLAESAGRLDEAQSWHHESLKLRRQIGDDLLVAHSCFKLGRVNQKHSLTTQRRADLNEAERWYLESANLYERLNEQRGAANVYHQIGMIKLWVRALSEAEGWYKRALSVYERIGDDGAAATSRHELGLVAEERGQRVDAGRLFARVLAVHLRVGDEKNAELSLSSFCRVLDAASAVERAQLLELWTEADLPPLPDLRSQ
jgi:tetratricopeptide (TPR) repeat protein